MNNLEFKNEFDILYNNIGSNQAPGIDNYELSVFLTRAQEQLVKNYFNLKGNKYQEGFAGSPKRDVDLSELVLTKDITSDIVTTGVTKLDERSDFFKIPGDLFFILNEKIDILDGDKVRGVTAISLDETEFNRLASMPYNEPLKRQCWKLLRSNPIINESSITEIITKTGTAIQKYVIRYVKKPVPIIIEDLEGDLSIQGVTTESQCELNETIHNEILDRAVELAKLAYNLQSLEPTVQLNQRNE